MSWGLSLQAKPADVEDKLRAAKEAQLEQSPYDSFDDDVDADMEKAIALAVEVAGDLDEDLVQVSIGGHRYREGTARSSFSISVYGMVPPAPPAKK